MGRAKNGRRQRFAFHVEPSLMPLRYLSGTEGTRVRGSIEQEMKNGNKTGMSNGLTYVLFPFFNFIVSFSRAHYLYARSQLRKPPVFTGNINGPSRRAKYARLLLLSHCEVILFLPMTILADSTIFR